MRTGKYAIRLFSLLLLTCCDCQSVVEAANDGKVFSPVADKWALVVGISKFSDPALNLKYSAKDALDLSHYLVGEAHFAPDHVRLLLDEQATRERILDELGDKWLPRVAAPDDLVFIFISSHGSPAVMDVGGVNYIVTHNTDKARLYSTGIPIQELTRLIKERVHANRVVLVLDACHSGAANVASKGISLQKNFNADEISQGTGQLVICSSQPDQVSWESQKYPNGVFTRQFINALKQGGETITLGAAYKDMKERVQQEVLRDRGELQTPLLKSKWEGDDLVLNAVPANPRPGLEEFASEFPPASTPKPEIASAWINSTAPLNQQSPTSLQTKAPVANAVWSTFMEAGSKSYKPGAYAEAEKMFASALKEAETSNIGDNRLAKSLDNLAASYFQQGRYLEAKTSLERALGSGDASGVRLEEANQAQILEHLATVDFVLGNWKEAELATKKVLPVWEQIMGSESAEVVRSLTLLGRIYTSQGRYAEAAPLLDRAGTINKSMLPSNYLNSAETLFAQAVLLAAQGQNNKAEVLARLAVEIWRKDPSLAFSALPGARTLLGNLLSLHGNVSRSDQEYSQAISSYQQLGLAVPADVVDSYRKLAALYSSQGKQARAEELLQRLSALAEKIPGATNPPSTTGTTKLALEPPTPPPEFPAPWKVVVIDNFGQRFSATWVWDRSRREFTGNWNEGSVAKILLEKFDQGQISLSHRGISGRGAGMRGKYIGQVSGNTAKGSFKGNWGLVPVIATWEASW